MELKMKTGKPVYIDRYEDISNFIMEVGIKYLFHSGRNIYHMCACNGRLDLMKYIEDYFTSDMEFLYNRDANNGDVLLLACWKGYLDIVKYLLEDKKWDIDTCDKFGNNVYIAAAMGGHVYVMEYLEKKYSIDIYFKNKRGKNVAMKAAEYYHKNVLTYLHEKHNYDFSILDNRSLTVICFGNEDTKAYLKSLLNNDGNYIVSKLKDKLDLFNKSIKSNEDRLSEINKEVNKLFVERLILNNSILELKKKKKEFKDKILKNI